MGRSDWPLIAKLCPLRLSWEIWTGPELPARRVIVEFATWPTATFPNATVVGDAASVPGICSTVTLPPHPDKTAARQQEQMKMIPACEGKNWRACSDRPIRLESVCERGTFRNAMSEAKSVFPSPVNPKSARIFDSQEPLNSFQSHFNLWPRPAHLRGDWNAPLQQEGARVRL